MRKTVTMAMEMHMVEVMYAPSDAVTIMAMVPYRQLSMDHQTRMDMEFTTDAQGVGDVGIHGLYSAFGNIERGPFSSSAWGPHRIVLRGGVVFPTGSIGARDDLPAGPDQKLPYPMQVGAGTTTLIIIILVIGAGVLGYLLYKKHQDNKKPANN